MFRHTLLPAVRHVEAAFLDGVAMQGMAFFDVPTLTGIFTQSYNIVDFTLDTMAFLSPFGIFRHPSFFKLLLFYRHALG